MNTTIIAGPVTGYEEELIPRWTMQLGFTGFEWRDRGMVVTNGTRLLYVAAGTLAVMEHEPDGAEGLREIVAAPDLAARTYTFDMGDGTDRVVAIYRRSDRFGYAWNTSDPRQSEYGYILD